MGNYFNALNYYASNLNIILLENNSFPGSIPASLANLTNLEIVQ